MARRAIEENPAQATIEHGVTPVWECGMNPEQVDAVRHDDGPFQLLAVAGCGKTRVVVHRIARLVRDRGVAGQDILAVTFSKAGADEMNKRLAELGIPDARVGTWHSLCLQILKEDRTQYAGWRIDETDRAKTIVKEVLGFRHLDWKRGDLGKIRRFIGRCKAMAWTWLDEGAKELAAAEFGHEAQLALRAYQLSQEMVEAASLLTFDDFLVFAHRHLQVEENRRRWAARWRYVIQDEAQDANLIQVLIAGLLAKDHRNYMIVGDPAQCHPPGVLVDVGDDRVKPIETLRDGDNVRSWNRRAQKMIGGREIKIASRPFRGYLRIVKVGALGTRTVPMTPNHRVLCRWSDRKCGAVVTYLMWRSDLGFRVGWCKLFANREGDDGFHLAHRARIEKAEKVWILKVHASRTSASVYESIVAAKYGIPTSTFEPVCGAMHLTANSIAQIFEGVQDAVYDSEYLSDAHSERGERVLRDHGREFDLPLYPWPGKTRETVGGRGTYFEVFAANIEPVLMRVPFPDATNQWAPILSVGREYYEGPVYSLDVAEDHSYAANGVVVLNSIYGFRGSKPDYLVAFEKDWSARRVAMIRNYRSGRAIIALANDVIRPAEIRLPEEMVAERGTEGTVTAKVCEDHDDEANEFGSWVEQRVAEGSKYGEIACLFRLNAQSRAPEEALLSRRIPYVILGGCSFYERKEVKDLLGYLRVAACRDSDGDALRRCLNAPFRFLGKAFLDRMIAATETSRRAGLEVDWAQVATEVSAQAGVQGRQRQSVSDWVRLLDEVREMTAEGDRPTIEGDGVEHAQRRQERAGKVLLHIVTRTDYVRAVERDEGEESVESSVAANVREIVRVAERFATVGELLDYIDKTIEASKRQRREKTGDRVVLMSCHKSKGLEYPRVWLVGANEMVLPHAKADDPEEERRIAYVAVTRARDELVISAVRRFATRAGVKEVAPSRFFGCWPASAALAEDCED